METHLRYRQSETGIAFCCWVLYEMKQEDVSVYFLEFNEGRIGELNKAHVELDPNPFELKKMEREIIEEYPIEFLPLKEHEISIELKNGPWHPEKIKEIEKKLLRSIEWNFIHTGLGYKAPKYYWKDHIFILRVKFIPNQKSTVILKEDFSHWIPTATIKVSELSY
ncbi:hypothetical protein N9W09_01145 [Crocinitomicaceae bacterium]|nr:hypothetical protein [Crocinitomicaceae bacterium]